MNICFFLGVSAGVVIKVICCALTTLYPSNWGFLDPFCAGEGLTAVKIFVERSNTPMHSAQFGLAQCFTSKARDVVSSEGA
jgi:hypothetical protein